MSTAKIQVIATPPPESLIADRNSPLKKAVRQVNRKTVPKRKLVFSTVRDKVRIIWHNTIVIIRLIWAC